MLHITVIPEFDMPGHAHAAIKSMKARYDALKDTNMTAATEFRLDDPDDTTEYLSVQQWSDNAMNPCIESTYTFVRKVMATVKDIHADVQPLEFYHFGGDEVAHGVWTNSTICQEFMQNHTELTKPHGTLLLYNKIIHVNNSTMLPDI